MSVERIELLGVPVDVCPPEDLENAILEMLAKPGTKQIVFLSIWKLLKARRKHSELLECLKSSDLILPISKSIIKGAKFLKLTQPIRYNPFTAVISILSVLDTHYKSLYLFGSHPKTLMQAERNVHETFPNLQIVGRCAGYYSKNAEADIVSAIYKSSPSLALLSEGIKEKDLWSYHRRNAFSSSIFLFYNDALGIFSERIRRVSEKTFERGLEIWSEILHNPFKIFLIFPFMGYKISLIWNRLFKK